MAAEAARSSAAAGAQVVPTDVTDLEQVRGDVQAAANERYGPVDVLVNNVGWDQLMFFTETTPEFWQKVIQVNYVGVLNCTGRARDDDPAAAAARSSRSAPTRAGRASRARRSTAA